MKTLLVWDIENIPIKQIQNIFKEIKFKPTDAFAVSKVKMPERTVKHLKAYDIKYIQTETIADVKIKEILLKSLDYNNFIIISNDSDFLFFLDLIEGKELQWFLTFQQSKAVLRRSSSKENVTYTVLGAKKKKIYIPRERKFGISIQSEMIAELYGIDVNLLNFLKKYEKEIQEREKVDVLLKKTISLIINCKQDELKEELLKLSLSVEEV